MKIIISQQEFINPRNNFSFDALERAFYKFLKGHDLIPSPNTMNLIHEDYECLVLTGGPDSVSRHLTENLLYQHATQNNRAVIGICHGAFVINDILGGQNGEIDGHKNTEHNVILQGAQIKVNSYHSQYIKKLADQLEPLAVDESGNCESFRHKNLKQWGIVWHPERMQSPVLPNDLKEFLFPTI